MQQLIKNRQKRIAGFLSLALLLSFFAFSIDDPKTAAAASVQFAASPRKDYKPAIEMLARFIEREITDKELPSLSIALVDDQEIVWSKGFGFANPKDKTPVTDETIYRVGSVSKLFTDIAIMQLVERGKLDLDAPVTGYLSEFHPRNSFEATAPVPHHPAESRRLRDAGMVLLPDEQEARSRCQLVHVALRAPQRVDARTRRQRSQVRRPHRPVHHRIGRTR